MCGSPSSTLVLSDFEQNAGVLLQQGGRTGYWYVFADANAGTQTPANVANGPIAVAPTSSAPTGDKTLAGETCNKYALHSTATGHTCPSNPGACFAGTGAAFVPGTGGTRNAYDVSAFDGIQFDIVTPSSTQGSVYFEMLTKESQPATAGGTATNTAVDAYNNRGYVLTAAGQTPTGTSTAIPTAWSTVYVPFALLQPFYFPQPSACGTSVCQAPNFVPTDALGFQFSIHDDFSTTGSYDLWVDNVSFYTGDNGLNPANPTGAVPTFNDGASGWSCAKPTFAGGRTAAGKYLLWAYRNWQTNFVRQAGSTTTPCTSSSTQCIVMSPEQSFVVSEGIGYGMLISAYMNDQTLFDRFWAYWAANPAAAPLMTWKFNQNGVGATGSGSATDADQDAAFALYLASKKWTTSPMGFNYASLAVSMINAIWTNDFDPNTHLPTEGSNIHTSEPTNPSYFAPAYYPIFAGLSGVSAAASAGFTAAVGAEYTALNKISGSTLPPAWCSNTCASAGGGGFANATDYQYDAHRVPWRVGVDFCWNGSTQASGYLNHLSQFFSGQVASSGGVGGGIDALFDEYTTANPPAVCTGCTPAAQPNSMSLVGTAAVGALAGGATYSSFVNAGWQFVLDGINRGKPNVDPTKTAYYTYFNSTVGLLTALTLSGNFYKL
ncbi:MAG TPA: glycosyl hydrolase family 8 [Polyangiaceae bacterium]|nr:glycosyl hydrolase family 8 [Polyangiaceae bacterium]